MTKPFPEYYALTLSLNFDLRVKWLHVNPPVSTICKFIALGVISDKDHIMAIIVLSNVLVVYLHNSDNLTFL